MIRLFNSHIGECDQIEIEKMIKKYGKLIEAQTVQHGKDAMTFSAGNKNYSQTKIWDTTFINEILFTEFELLTQFNINPWSNKNKNIFYYLFEKTNLHNPTPLIIKIPLDFNHYFLIAEQVFDIEEIRDMCNCDECLTIKNNRFERQLLEFTQRLENKI